MEIKEKVAGICGNNLLATLKGKKRVKFKQTDGTLKKRLLYPVEFVNDLKCNLFSITSKMTYGDATISSNENSDIVLRYTDG